MEEGASRGGRQRRRELTPGEIVDTSVRIADAEGLDAVSIRRIAAELDARPMSLYDHFASKDDLLAAMSDSVTVEALLPLPPPPYWRDSLVAIAARTYAMLVAHPWVVRVIGKRPLGPNATKLAKQLARATEDLPLGEAERWSLLSTLNDYVVGHSIRAAAVPATADFENVVTAEDLVDSPELRALPESLRTLASVERFEVGLHAVLDGIEVRFLGRLD